MHREQTVELHREAGRRLMNESSFVTKIVDDPQNDVPRLIFADWLSDQGDPRGEFIRAQCLLARMDDRDPRRLDLEWIERKWLAEFGPASDRALRESTGIVSGEYRRGMLTKLVISADAFVENHQQILDAAPARDIRFVGVKQDWDRLLDCEALSQLSGIDFLNTNLGMSRLEQLLARTDLSQLRSLRLGGAAKSRRAIRLIARSPNLSGLQELVLDGTPTDPDSMPLLATAPFATSLTRLSVAGCGLFSESLESLSRADVFPKLISLDLSDNADADSEFWQWFFGSPRFDRLHELSIRECFLSSADVSFLARIRQPMELRRLDLRGAYFNESAAKSLGMSSCLRGLTHLSLEACGLDDELLRALMENAEGARVRSLALGLNDFTADGLAAVMWWSGASGLSELGLSSNPLNDPGVGLLIQSKALANLNRLDLRLSGVRETGARRLAGAKNLDRLTELHLTYQLPNQQGHAFGELQKTAIEDNFGSHVCHFT